MNNLKWQKARLLQDISLVELSYTPDYEDAVHFKAGREVYAAYVGTRDSGYAQYMIYDPSIMDSTTVQKFYLKFEKEDTE